MSDVVETIKNNPEIRMRELEPNINMRRGRIKVCIKYLTVNGDSYVENSKYYKSAREWKPNIEKSRRITEIRENEPSRMAEFSRQNDCYMEFIAKN